MPLTLRVPAFTQPGKPREFMNEVVVPFLERNLEYLIYELEQITPEGVTGNLRGGYTSEIRGYSSNENFRGIITNDIKYIKYVDEGTAPHWAPIENLRGWAELKGINPYALQAHIAVHGTKPQHIFDQVRANAFPAIMVDWQRTIGALWQKYKR